MSKEDAIEYIELWCPYDKQKEILEALSAEPQGDLISREEALACFEALKNYSGLTIREQLRKLMLVNQTEWISVKEHGKPKEAGVYYVTVQKENGDRNVIRDRFYGGNSTYFWEELTYELIGAKYIAWQPITEPSPYKGE